MAEGSKVGAAYVELTTDSTKYQQGMTQAASTLSAFGTMAKVAIPAALGVAAAAAVAFGKKSVDAWAIEEQAQLRLGAAIRLHGGAVTELLPKYNRLATVLQRQTSFSDDEIKKAMAYGLSLGVEADQIENVTRASIGLGTVVGGLDTAMRLLARASMGQTGQLKRYGIVVDDNLSAGEKFNAVLNRGNQLFKVQQALTHSVTGQAKQMSMAWSDLKESVGSFLAKELHLTDWLAKAAQVIQGFTKDTNLTTGAMKMLDATAPGTFGAISDGLSDATEKAKKFKESLSILSAEDSWGSLLQAALGDIGADEANTKAGKRRTTATRPRRRGGPVIHSGIGAGIDPGQVQMTVVEQGVGMGADGAPPIGAGLYQDIGISKVEAGARAIVDGVKKLARFASGDPGIGAGLGGTVFTETVH